MNQDWIVYSFPSKFIIEWNKHIPLVYATDHKNIKVETISLFKISLFSAILTFFIHDSF
jgi:hypothetical protein